MHNQNQWITNNHPTFAEVYPTEDIFKESYNKFIKIETEVTQDDLGELYLYMISKWAMANIRYDSEEHFKLTIATEINKLFPTYKYKIANQKALRKKTTEELNKINRQITNMAANPNQYEKSNLEGGELGYLDSQQATSVYQNDLETVQQQQTVAIGWLWDDFLNKFAKFFQRVLLPQDIQIYIEE